MIILVISDDSTREDNTPEENIADSGSRKEFTLKLGETLKRFFKQEIRISRNRTNKKISTAKFLKKIIAEELDDKLFFMVNSRIGI